MKYIKVIIKDYQVDHFVRKSTFWTKWTPEISPLASPYSDKIYQIVKKGRQDVDCLNQGNH